MLLLSNKQKVVICLRLTVKIDTVRAHNIVTTKKYYVM